MSDTKRRPAVVVSNDRANAAAERLGRGVVTVVPITSNVARMFPFHTLLPASATGLRLDSKAQAEHVRSVSVERVGAVLGHLPGQLMSDLNEAAAPARRSMTRPMARPRTRSWTYDAQRPACCPGMIGRSRADK